MRNWNESDIKKLEAKGMVHTKSEKKYSQKKKNNIPKKEPKAVGYIRLTLKILRLRFKEEYRFLEDRKFRFDFALTDFKIAIEYEGVNSVKSRHTSITGYTRDSEKYNLAQINGWKVLRYTVLNYEEVENDLKNILST